MTLISIFAGSTLPIVAKPIPPVLRTEAQLVHQILISAACRTCCHKYCQLKAQLNATTRDTRKFIKPANDVVS
ncbi:hypothetical protein BDD12DRAFT_913982 [Trichophaea hybrida]|nr:hypothetical protein BDD12DRAFT_913982 [Trichophaea hybrida]